MAKSELSSDCGDEMGEVLTVSAFLSLSVEGNICCVIDFTCVVA